ncbi:MAG: hypothetical protein NC191_02715 [Muribaculaceae bacterium]|nr:hypothetical protein [Muribaculaceae bacterium]
MRMYPKILRGNPEQIFRTFRTGVSNTVQNNRPINYKAFSCELNDICEVFEKEHRQKELNRVAMRFAESLVGLGNQSLAGIVYSVLIKLNQNNPEIVEQLAIKALAIAKRQHDPIHTMARANDLKRIYKVAAPGSEKHLKALYTAKRALVDICSNYEKVKLRYQSVSTKMKPLEKYEIMLASIRVEISKAIKSKTPQLAESELTSARETFLKLNHGDRVEEIDKLLSSLQKINLKNSCK